MRSTVAESSSSAEVFSARRRLDSLRPSGSNPAKKGDGSGLRADGPVGQRQRRSHRGRDRRRRLEVLGVIRELKRLRGDISARLRGDPPCTRRPGRRVVAIPAAWSSRGSWPSRLRQQLEAQRVEHGEHLVEPNGGLSDFESPDETRRATGQAGQAVLGESQRLAAISDLLAERGVEHWHQIPVAKGHDHAPSREDTGIDQGAVPLPARSCRSGSSRNSNRGRQQRVPSNRPIIPMSRCLLRRAGSRSGSACAPGRARWSRSLRGGGAQTELCRGGKHALVVGDDLAEVASELLGRHQMDGVQ